MRTQVNKVQKDDTVAMHAKDPLTSDLSEGKIDVKATKEYGCNSKRRCRRGKDFENGGRATLIGLDNVWSKAR